MALSNFATIVPDLGVRVDANMSVLEDLKVGFPGGANALRNKFEDLSWLNCGGLHYVRPPRSAMSRLIYAVQKNHDADVMSYDIRSNMPLVPQARIALYNSRNGGDALLHYVDVGIAVEKSALATLKAMGMDGEMAKVDAAINAENAQKAAFADDRRRFTAAHPGYKMLSGDDCDLMFWALLARKLGIEDNSSKFPLSGGSMRIKPSTDDADVKYAKSWNGKLYIKLCSYTSTPPLIGLTVTVAAG
jgi:hypothetical protein